VRAVGDGERASGGRELRHVRVPQLVGTRERRQRPLVDCRAPRQRRRAARRQVAQPGAQLKRLPQDFLLVAHILAEIAISHGMVDRHSLSPITRLRSI
jgi:hypothetical protein